MRCPKCHYLSFDPEPRCKNCGYDLEVADADLALRTAENGEDSLPDLTLRDRPAAPAPHVTLELVRPEPESRSAKAPRMSLVYEAPEEAYDESADDAGDEADPVVAAPPPPLPVPRAPFRAPNTTAELPLFVKAMADRAEAEEEPAIAPAPRPLGVRRAAPEPVRARPKMPERRLGPLDHDLLEDLKRVEREEALQARSEARTAFDRAADRAARVEPIHRAGAAAVDAAVLGGIATFVFWATLRLCHASLSGLGLSALVPLVLFLALIDIGYLLMFTAAGGQTFGKMLMGIRVVGNSVEDGEYISFRQAAWRAALTMVSVIGLGLGWLPALFGGGMTLHDRLAHTRVVRA